MQVEDGLDGAWERARLGDRDALLRLITDHRERLLSRIRLILGDEARRQADSQDFCQQVLVDALGELDRFEPRSEKQLLRWLTTIARNNVIDLARRRRAIAFDSLSESWRSDRGVVQRESSPASVADANEERMLLVEALESLETEQRQAIELRDLEGLSWSEIGERLARSADAARKLHARAMIRLGRALPRGRA